MQIKVNKKELLEIIRDYFEIEEDWDEISLRITPKGNKIILTCTD